MVGESCTCEWLSERLVSTGGGDDAGSNVLLLDCRSVADYKTSHVKGSIHVTVPSIMMRRLRVGSVAVATVVGSTERKRFTDRCKSDPVVLYDGGVAVAANDAVDVTSSCNEQQMMMKLKNDELSAAVTNGTRSEVVSLLMGRLRTDGCCVYYLQGGFTDFQRKYGHLCVGEVEQPVKDVVDEGDRVLSLGLTTLRLTDISLDDANRKEGRGSTPGSAFPFPVQVVPFLFLGNAENSSDLACLTRHDIRYILNVTADIPNTFETDLTFKYLQIPITDNLSQNLTSFFPAAIAFIDEARNKSCGVLVHCLAGISRSVTVTVAYLMYTMSLSLNDAYDFLRRCKPNISPNFNFMGQLLDFEMVLRQRQRCTCTRLAVPTSCGGGGGGAGGVDLASPSCATCQDTKTYFSSPAQFIAAPADQSTTTVTSPTLLPKSTSSPASSMMSSMASSSAMSISSLTSEAADCA